MEKFFRFQSGLIIPEPIGILHLETDSHDVVTESKRRSDLFVRL